MQYLRLSIQGSLPGNEVWSINPCFAPVGGSAVTPTPSQMASAVQAARSVPRPPSMLQQLSSAGRVTALRLEARGFSSGLEQVGVAAVTPAESGTGNATKPYQTAMVVSLRTAFPGGRRRGRVYLPALASVIDVSTLRVGQGVCTTIAQGFYQYLEQLAVAMSTPLGLDVYPAVISGTSKSVELITYVEVGDVLDVQRRRRDKAVESRYRFPAGV